MRVGKPGYQQEMQFIYTSSHGQRVHSVYKVSYLYRMDYICKNKNLKTTGQREPPPSPNDPSMR